MERPAGGLGLVLGGMEQKQHHEGCQVRKTSLFLVVKAQHEHLCCEKSAGQRHRNRLLHPLELHVQTGVRFLT